MAHLYLTFPYRRLSIGNLLGDMLKNEQVDGLGQVFREGVMIHRFIDSYTDRHSALDEARNVLRPRHRKYTPVVLDILLDYVLVEEWESYSSLVFEQFQAWVYHAIEAELHEVPQGAGMRLQHMANGRWLSSYSNRDDFQLVLERMDKRARFASNFGDAMLDLDVHRQLFGEALAELLEDLHPQVKSLMMDATLRSEGTG